jgi:hypothetical protein
MRLTLLLIEKYKFHLQMLSLQIHLEECILYVSWSPLVNNFQAFHLSPGECHGNSLLFNAALK